MTAFRGARALPTPPGSREGEREREREGDVSGERETETETERDSGRERGRNRERESVSEGQTAVGAHYPVAVYPSSGHGVKIDPQEVPGRS